MYQRMARRIIAAGILAAALLVVGPAEATGWSDWRETSPGIFEKAWSWVLGWWDHVDLARNRVSSKAPRRNGVTGVYQYDGGCIDPNGLVVPCPSH